MISKENGQAIVESYKNYKLTESRFFRSYKFKPDGSYDTEKIDKQEPVFLFKCLENEIEYNNMGRVKIMRFNCVLNEHEIINY